MAKHLTVEQVKKMTGRETIYVIDRYNADGSPMNYRRNGKIEFWKTRPDEFRIPVKRGLYEFGEVNPNNMHTVTLDRPADIPKKEVYKGRRVKG